MRLLDVSKPDDARLIWAGPRKVLHMAHDGPLLYFVTADGVLHIVDVTHPDAPAARGTVSVPGYPFGLAVRDGLAAVAAYDAGVSLVDVRDPDAPRRLGGTTTRDRAWGVALDHNLLYVADGHAGLSVVDISDPSAPRLLTGS
jgi:hypothetical protein